jgi:hypothetical protein
VTARKTIGAHEKTCFRNPARRACLTCKHEEPGYVDEPDYTTGYHYEEPRSCRAGDDVLPERDDGKDPIRWDCPKWEPKEQP